MVVFVAGGFWLMIALMSAQHATPTAVRNESAHDVQFRWRHEDFNDWSVELDLRRGACESLARRHFVAQFTGLAVTEGERYYRLEGAAFRRLQRACPRPRWDPLVLSGQCEISYLGSGRFRLEPMEHDAPVECPDPASQPTAEP